MNRAAHSLVTILTELSGLCNESAGPGVYLVGIYMCIFWPCWEQLVQCCSNRPSDTESSDTRTLAI